MPDPYDHVFVAMEGLQHRASADMTDLLGGAIEGMRGSFGRILGLIPDEGARPSSLADGASITKQAVGERIKDLVERGWVTVAPDPRDGRAVIVRRTPEGDRVRRITLDTIEAMEARWAEQVGAERYDAFRSVLDELAAEHLRPPVVPQR